MPLDAAAAGLMKVAGDGADEAALLEQLEALDKNGDGKLDANEVDGQVITIGAERFRGAEIIIR